MKPSLLKEYIKRTFLYDFWKAYKFYLKERLGRKRGIFKQKVLLQYARSTAPKTFIETGTYLGDMVWAMRTHFEKIYSIELDDELYARAQKRFSDFPHIKIFHGDSAKVLPEIIANKVAEPCFFWLDAHYSRGITAKGDLYTPVEKEILTILNHPVKNHVILIDDAKSFNGSEDYPTLEQVKNLVAKQGHYAFKLADNIIRIIPANDNKHL